MKVFVAGATGVLGRALVPVLVAAGHDVVGSTRSASRTGLIEAAGATAVICDALDPDAVHRTVTEAAPEVVIHQLTALPDSFAKLRRGSEPTNRLRREGTRHLVEAAVAAGTRRVIAESIAFLYPPSRPGLAGEEEPIWIDAPQPYATMIAALAELEHTVTRTPGIEGIVLRYGTLYGPGTFYAPHGDLIRQLRKRRMPIVGSGAGITSFLHVNDAATATTRALRNGAPGVYNVTDDDPVWSARTDQRRVEDGRGQPVRDGRAADAVEHCSGHRVHRSGRTAQGRDLPRYRRARHDRGQLPGHRRAQRVGSGRGLQRWLLRRPAAVRPPRPVLRRGHPRRLLPD